MYVCMYVYICFAVTDSIAVQPIVMYKHNTVAILLQVQLMEHSSSILVLEYFSEALGACSW